MRGSSESKIKPKKKVILLSGPGGDAFGKGAILVAEKALEHQGVEIIRFGNGVKPLTEKNINAFFTYIRNCQSHITLIIHAHGKGEQENNHCINLKGDKDWVNAASFIKRLSYNLSNRPIDVFSILCYGRAIQKLSRDLLPKNSSYVSLAPAHSITPGGTVKELFRVLGSNNTPRGCVTAEVLLIVYLTKCLKTRIAPALTSPNTMIGLDSNLASRLGKKFSQQEKESIQIQLKPFVENKKLNQIIDRIEQVTEEHLIEAEEYGIALAICHAASGDMIFELQPTSTIFSIKQPDKFQAWYNTSYNSTVFRQAFKKNMTKNSSEYSYETRGKSFENYKAETDTQHDMLELAKKFAFSVIQSRKEPIGFILTGTPGIGKTHLSVAIANRVDQSGLYVVFLTEENISEERMQCIRRTSPDLVIIDDVNNIISSERFVKQVFQYVIKTNAAIIITSNNPISRIEEYLFDLLEEDDLRISDNFLNLQNNTGKSHRDFWWNKRTFSLKQGEISSSGDAVELLAKHRGGAAGILIEMDGIYLKKIKSRFICRENKKSIKVRVVGKPYYNNSVYDFYVSGKEKYDAYIIKVDHHDEVEQLLTLIPHIHDEGKKIIIVTKHIGSFQDLTNEGLKSSCFYENADRLRDRMRSFILTMENWNEVLTQDSGNMDQQSTFFKKNLNSIDLDNEAKLLLERKDDISCCGCTLF